ncbi:unnamed protein product [Amoebophrya sp. A25]|nr:unnamed protein product [Amoebophrya sp. A25]|eukprot:GSA25T00001976001.1
MRYLRGGGATSTMSRMGMGLRAVYGHGGSSSSSSIQAFSHRKRELGGPGVAQSRRWGPGGLWCTGGLSVRRAGVTRRIGPVEGTSEEGKGITQVPCSPADREALLSLTSSLLDREPFLARALVAELEKTLSRLPSSRSAPGGLGGRTVVGSAQKTSGNEGREVFSHQEDTASNAKSSSSSSAGLGPAVSPVGGEDSSQNKVWSARSALAAKTQVEQATFARSFGGGKTNFFAFLSQRDKTRILQLCRESLSIKVDEDILQGDRGKTAFFAALPGEAKFKALMAWRREKEREFLMQRSITSAGPPGPISAGDFGGLWNGEEQRETMGDADDIATAVVPSIPISELRKLFFLNAGPMVGFGFTDNFLLIILGASIENSFGMYVSTLAAAGLGNLFSNIIGMGLAEWIEYFAEKIGLPRPKMSRAQKRTHLARITGLAGTITGLTIGCLLGLVPVLFLGEKDASNGSSTATEGDEEKMQ